MSSMGPLRWPLPPLEPPLAATSGQVKLAPARFEAGEGLGFLPVDKAYGLDGFLSKEGGHAGVQGLAQVGRPATVCGDRDGAVAGLLQHRPRSPSVLTS